MYLTRVRIANIRSIAELDWQVSLPEAPGWHVILGDNGSGKSSMLRSIALALLGPVDAQALRQDWAQWLRREEESGSVRLDLWWDRQIDLLSGSGRGFSRNFLPVAVEFEREGSAVTISKRSTGVNAYRFVWSSQRRGWFSASYGPFRQFLGGDHSYDRLYYSNPRVAAHLSVFDEASSLLEGLTWLRELHVRREDSAQTRALLNSVLSFVNEADFLPHGAKLARVHADGIDLIDANGFLVPVEEMSDGYRSLLSMTFDLIRQMAAVYPASEIFSPDGTSIEVPGVVLIDEVDAHLHPEWQRKVGFWFQRHFPYFQFIVATHSPLVCQAAIEGSIFRLPTPGSGEKAGMVTDPERGRLLYGDVLEAYSTDLFGDVRRSDASLDLFTELASLNVQERVKGLTAEERSRQAYVRSVIPTPRNTD